MVHLKLIDHLQTAIDRSTAVIVATAEAVAGEKLVACARGDGTGVSFVTQMVMVVALFAVCTGLPELATKNFRKYKEFV